MLRLLITITSCKKYKVLNMLHTFNSVGDINFSDIPLKGNLKSIEYAFFLSELINYIACSLLFAG